MEVVPFTEAPTFFLMIKARGAKEVACRVNMQ
jgi:hypothetical protein